MGTTAITGSFLEAAPVALPLYAGGVCWTLLYDTLYGYQVRCITRKTEDFFRFPNYPIISKNEAAF